MYTCDEFAARVLDLPKLMNPLLEAVAVTAKFLQFEDILPGMIRVVGFRKQDVLLSATAEGAVLGIADADDSDNKNLDDDGQQQSGAGPSDAFSDGLDLLGMLEAAADPPPKRQNRFIAAKKQAKSRMIVVWMSLLRLCSGIYCWMIRVCKLFSVQRKFRHSEVHGQSACLHQRQLICATGELKLFLRKQAVNLVMRM
jgi:hypothetical protein